VIVVDYEKGAIERNDDVAGAKLLAQVALDSVLVIQGVVERFLFFLLILRHSSTRSLHFLVRLNLTTRNKA
jgi:hypothetical protein